MISYWEQQSLLSYDHIVIGAGIVGLSVALELRAAAPRATILVLERGLLPTGASTRNAGFACMGGLSELLDDLQHMPQEEVLQLFSMRKEGLSLLRKRLGDATIDYREEGSHEMLSEQELSLLDKMDSMNAILKPLTGYDVFQHEKPTRLKEFGFNERTWKAIISIRGEGMLHTGKMMRALIDLTTSQGIEIKTGCLVTGFEEAPKQVHVFVEDTYRKTVLPFSAQQLWICTNAFTGALLEDVPMQPGRGQVAVTSKIDGLQLKGIYHFDQGYYYFRELDGRVLLGGGRNLAFEEENTTAFAFNHRIQQELERQLRENILPNKTFTIEHRWAGIMAFGASKFPIAKQLSPRVFAAYRMGGMGVALGSKVAKELLALSHP